MSRPTRREDSRSGLHSIEGAHLSMKPTTELNPEATAEGTGAANIAPGAGAETLARPRRVSASKHKLSIYQHPEDTARLRAAYRQTLAASSDRSFSDFINRLLMTEVEHLEAQHNGGQPFPGVGAGELPTGRPIGE